MPVVETPLARENVFKHDGERDSIPRFDRWSGIKHRVFAFRPMKKRTILEIQARYFANSTIITYTTTCSNEQIIRNRDQSV